MYNRYICRDDGSYTRIPEEEPDARAAPETTAPPPPEQARSGPQSTPPPGFDGPGGPLRHLLDQLHLDSIDTGDLLLLGLLFFLYREHADEELLMALGLLLIL